MLPIAAYALGFLRRASEAARARRGEPAVRSAFESVVRLGALVRVVSSDVVTLVYRILGLPLALASAVLGHRLQLPLAPGTARAASLNLGPYRCARRGGWGRGRRGLGRRIADAESWVGVCEHRGLARTPRASDTVSTNASPRERAPLPLVSIPLPAPSSPRRLTFAVERRRRPDASACGDAPAERPHARSGRGSRSARPRVLSDPPEPETPVSSGPSTPLRALRALAEYSRLPGSSARAAAAPRAPAGAGAPSGAHRRASGDLAGMAALGAMGSLPSESSIPAPKAPSKVSNSKTPSPPKVAPRHAKHRSTGSRREAQPASERAARATSSEDREFLAAAKSFAAVGVAEEKSANTIKAGRSVRE